VVAYHRYAALHGEIETAAPLDHPKDVLEGTLLHTLDSAPERQLQSVLGAWVSYYPTFNTEQMNPR